MPLRDATAFASQLLVIVLLGMIYVAGLTIQTLFAQGKQAVAFLLPTSNRNRPSYASDS